MPNRSSRRDQRSKRDRDQDRDHPRRTGHRRRRGGRPPLELAEPGAELFAAGDPIDEVLADDPNERYGPAQHEGAPGRLAAGPGATES